MTDSISIRSKDSTLFEWNKQSTVNPLEISHGEGVYFWDTDGKRYLDFNSQAMCVNIGHGDPYVIAAINDQLHKIPYVAGWCHTTEVRAKLGEKLQQITKGVFEKFFFTNSGAEANEHAIKIARLFTGKHKIISRYRSYHGSTFGAASLSGDPRRWAVEPGLPGVIHVHDPFQYRCRWCKLQNSCNLECLNSIEDTILFEGADNIAAIILEPVTGSNGIIIPCSEYMMGLRELCYKNNILLICDEVMSGFGRTGKWFAYEHFGIKPDIVTAAKGLTSGYIPLGCVMVSKEISHYFEDNVLNTGLTYNSHPVACAAACACIDVYENKDLITKSHNLGMVLKKHLLQMKEDLTLIGDVRCIGLFACIELVKDRRSKTPLVSFNASPSELALMKNLNKNLLKKGLFVYTRWSMIFIIPPLIISEEQLYYGLQIISEEIKLLEKAVLNETNAVAEIS